MDVQGGFPFGKSPPRPRPDDKSPERASYLSLLDAEPAAGKVSLRAEPDYNEYDTEFAAMLAEKSKGTKIQFPDMYRAKT